jgi:triphosphatase
VQNPASSSGLHLQIGSRPGGVTVENLMAKETEIKLRITPETLAALQSHPLLQQRACGPWQTGKLCNQYYDTADRQLSGARVALRIRRDGEAFIQTLKSRGESVAGLSERNEWDWYLPEPRLQLDLLDDQCWPAALADLDKTSLQPVFTTDFERTKVLLRWQREDQTIEVEAALDRGEVVAGDAREPICELELEIRQGPAVALLELAHDLSTELALMPCDISKAERGYRLFEPASYELRPISPHWDVSTEVDAIIAGTGRQLLGQSQRLAEQYRFSGHWKLFRELVGQLGQLRAFFAVFDLALPRSSSQAFVQPLEQLLSDWRPLVLAGWSDDEAGREARERAPLAFAEATSRPDWGRLFIGLALWLQEESWKLDRPPRGNKVAALELPRWLLAAVAREIQELRVPHHNDSDRDVNDWLDQQPRLARLHFLLVNFRSFLDVPEPDRLFGELNKLMALLEQYPLVAAEQQPAMLEALRKQGQRLRKLNAWRDLNH